MLKLHSNPFIKILNSLIHLDYIQYITILLSFLSYILTSCEKHSVNDITLPLDEMYSLSGNIYKDSTLTILLYCDSMACTSCVFKDLYLWKKLLGRYNENIQMCVIFNYPILRIKELDIANKVEKIDVHLFVDTIGIFQKYNINKINLLENKSFLISKDKKHVLFKGEPLNKRKDKKILLNTIETILKNKNQ